MARIAQNSARINFFLLFLVCFFCGINFYLPAKSTPLREEFDWRETLNVSAF